MSTRFEQRIIIDPERRINAAVWPDITRQQFVVVYPGDGVYVYDFHKDYDIDTADWLVQSALKHEKLSRWEFLDAHRVTSI